VQSLQISWMHSQCNCVMHFTESSRRRKSMIIEQSFYDVVAACNQKRATVIAANHRRRAQLSTRTECNNLLYLDIIFRSIRVHTCIMQLPAMYVVGRYYAQRRKSTVAGPKRFFDYCRTVTCVWTKQYIVTHISKLIIAGPHIVLDWDGKFLERIVRVMFNQWEVEII